MLKSFCISNYATDCLMHIEKHDQNDSFKLNMHFLSLSLNNMEVWARNILSAYVIQPLNEALVDWCFECVYMLMTMYIRLLAALQNLF